MASLVPRSVRARAVLGAAVAMTVFGLIIGAASYVLVSRVAQAAVEEVLSTRMADVAEQLHERGFVGQDLDLAVVEHANPVYLQVADAAGNVLSQTPKLPDGLAACTSGTGSPVPDTVTATSAGVTTTFTRERRTVSTPDGSVLLCGVVSNDAVDRAQSAVLLALLVVLPLVIGGVCLAVWFAVGRALRAVDDLRSQAESMEHDASATLVVQPTGDEVEALGHTLNALLADLNHQSATTRQFVADAGHELRNPLTTLRLSLEFGRDASDAELRDSVTDALADLTRLEELVQDLLALARSDSIDRPDHFREVDLSGVVLAAADGVRRTRPDCVVELNVEPTTIIGDEGALRSMVVNLIDNATRHAVSRIEISLAQAGEEQVLRVEDDGAGLLPEDCDRVFDRFVRLDEARHRDVGGSGLGLAIVQAVAGVHGGRVVASPGPGGHFEVALPARKTARFTRS